MRRIVYIIAQLCRLCTAVGWEIPIGREAQPLLTSLCLSAADSVPSMERFEAALGAPFAHLRWAAPRPRHPAHYRERSYNYVRKSTIWYNVRLAL